MSIPWRQGTVTSQGMTPPIGSMQTNDFIRITYKGINKRLLTCMVSQRQINYRKGHFSTHTGDD